MKKAIDVAGLPKGGPYSHANVAGDLVFVSGQTGQVAGKETTFTQQFENSMEKIKTILEGCGASLDKVTKISVYMSRKEDFKVMNELFGKYFPSNPPARTTLVVGFVAEGISVEVDVIATK
jgi:2-iminobutanoate/2-iminopropanoate deaminase